MMSKLDCYLTVFLQGIAVMMEVHLSLFVWSTCASEMNQAEWACWVAVLVGFQVVSHGRLLLGKKDCLDRQAFRVRLQIVSLFIIILLGVYLGLARILWAMLDHCPEAQTLTMKGMLSLNIAFCLLCATRLLACKPQAASAPQNLGAAVKLPQAANANKLLAHLTLQTFTQKTQSSQTDQVGACVICLSGPYSQGEVVTELHCHHTFHSSCIAGWILHGCRGCPMRCKPGPIMAKEVDVEAAAAPISPQLQSLAAAPTSAPISGETAV